MSEETPQGVPNDWAGIGETITGLADGFRRVSQWWRANRETILEALGWAVSSLHFSAQLERTGWLPHYTTPDLGIGLDDRETDALVECYYVERWKEVETAFLARLSAYAIDEEAKACFHEALSAHGMGLYRVAPRLLFPEIERIFRAELGDLMKVTSGFGLLREATKELGSDNFVRTGVLTLRLYGAFVERAYAQAETDEQIARALADPVPNRNAAIHGRVIYKSQKTSLNALIFAEFVLLTVGAVRAAAVSPGLDGPPGNGAPALGIPSVAGNRNWRRLMGLEVETDPKPLSACTRAMATGGQDELDCT